LKGGKFLRAVIDNVGRVVKIQMYQS